MYDQVDGPRFRATRESGRRVRLRVGARFDWSPALFSFLFFLGEIVLYYICICPRAHGSPCWPTQPAFETSRNRDGLPEAQENGY